MSSSAGTGEGRLREGSLQLIFLYEKMPILESSELCGGHQIQRLEIGLKGQNNIHPQNALGKASLTSKPTDKKEKVFRFVLFAL